LATGLLLEAVAEGNGLTVTLTDAQEVVLQVPSNLT
jgi:hypothetical protein